MADPSTSAPLTRASVVAAHDLVRPHVHRTPTVRNATLNALASRQRDAAELTGTTWEFIDASPAAAGGTGREKRTPANPRIRLWLKCENFQRVGAFKVRGAFHALERLAREPGWAEGGGRERGVVTHSSGAFASSCPRLLFFFFFAFAAFPVINVLLLNIYFRSSSSLWSVFYFVCVHYIFSSVSTHTIVCLKVRRGGERDWVMRSISDWGWVA